MLKPKWRIVFEDGYIPDQEDLNVIGEMVKQGYFYGGDFTLSGNPELN